MEKKLNGHNSIETTYLCIEPEKLLEMTECEVLALILDLPDLNRLMDDGYFNANAFAILGSPAVNRLYVLGSMIKSGSKITIAELEQAKRFTRTHLLQAGIMAKTHAQDTMSTPWSGRNEEIKEKLEKGKGNHYLLYQRRNHGIHRGEGRYSKQRKK